MKIYPNVTAYLKAQSKEVLPQLQTMYVIVTAVATKATEAIKCGMSTLVGNKDLVYLAR